MANRARVTLGGGREVFVPVVDQSHGTARLAGEQCRVDRHDRGVLLLATEPTPRFRLDHDRLLVGQGQCPFEGTVDVVGALQRSHYRDAAVVVGLGDGALRLDVELLLQPHPKRSLDDDSGITQRRVDVALHDLDRAVGLGGVFDREHRRHGVVGDGDVARGFLESRFVGSGKEQDRLGLMAYLTPQPRQRGLVVADQLHDVLAGDVVRGRHHHPRPIEARVERDRAERPARNRRPDRLAVPRTRHDEIVGLTRPPGDLVGALEARN